MRIVCISDTHGFHRQLDLPEGDLLIHAGDFSNTGEPEMIADFLDWFAGQAHAHKVFIAGNHDFLAEKEPETFRTMIPDSLIYLEDSAAEVAGLKLWGSPITPWFFDWAFNRQRGEEIAAYWAMIPEETDLLITHGPPFGLRDMNLHGQITGCEDLNRRVWEVNPRLHVFGHIHEGHGTVTANKVSFINASSIDVHYREKNPPIVYDWN